MEQSSGLPELYASSQRLWPQVEAALRAASSNSPSRRLAASQEDLRRKLKLTGQLPSPPGVGMKILKLTQGRGFLRGRDLAQPSWPTPRSRDAC